MPVRDVTWSTLGPLRFPGKLHSSQVARPKLVRLRMTPADPRASLPRPAPENERGVGASKSKRIRKRVFDRGLARVIRHVIQIALRIWILKINRGRERLVAQR